MTDWKALALTLAAALSEEGAAPYPVETRKTPTLSRSRAQTMHRKLGKLGFKRDEHYALAERVTRREVKSLTSLSENEAARVWSLALKESENHLSAARAAAAPVSDEDALAILN